MQDTGSAFARWINVERLGRETLKVSLTASEEECRELADQLQIQTVNALSLNGELYRKDGTSLIELKGTVTADVEQACVVSLKPVQQKIEEDFVMCYTFSRDDAFIEDVDYVVSMEEEDLPELIQDGQIDIVHAAVEQVALALDPYPRAEDIDESLMSSYTADQDETEEDAGIQTQKPFAGLKDLLKKD